MRKSSIAGLVVLGVAVALAMAALAQEPEAQTTFTVESEVIPNKAGTPKDPQGVKITSFKAPTEEELAHDFLWRIRRALPGPGHLGVFDRSHYEDVLVVRVHDLVPPQVWGERYDTINVFEQELAAAGTTLVKVMLHISPEEQKERLLARLDSVDQRASPVAWEYGKTPGVYPQQEASR